MVRFNKPSFATIRISGGTVSIAQRKKRDPRYPTEKIGFGQIDEYIPEGEDGNTWGYWNIPIFMDQPLDQSNRAAIQEKFEEDVANGEAILDIDHNILYIKIFDDTDHRERGLVVDNVASLEKTETYHKLVDIVNRIDGEGGELNPEDVAYRRNAYVLEVLERDCQNMNALWFGHAPQDWAQLLRSWLEEQGEEYSNGYSYDPRAILKGLKELKFLNPEKYIDDLSPEDGQKLLEIDAQIKQSEEIWTEFERVYPDKVDKYAEIHNGALAELKAARERFLLGVAEQTTNPNQMELPFDPQAAEHNRDIIERAERSMDSHVSMLRGMLDRSVSEFSESLSFPSDDDFVFASSNRMVACGRERRRRRGINQAGKLHRSIE